MKITDKCINFLEYIVAICMILDFHSVWTRVNSDLKTINSLVLFVTLAILGLIVIKYIIRNKKEFTVLLIIITSIVIYNIIFISFNQINTKNFILVFLVILLEFIIYSIYNIKINKNNVILTNISNVIIILSVISLVFYIFGSNMNLVSPNKQVLIDWGGEHFIPSYYNLYYETQITFISNFRVIRNSGIFNEPAIYAACLCLALIPQLFLNAKKNKIKIGIILFTLVTTFSTTGIIVGLLLTCISLFFRRTYRIKNSIKILLMPILVFCSIYVIVFFINDKLIQSKYNSRGSYSVRMDDIRVGIEAWKDHKFLGNGYNDKVSIQNYMDLSIRGVDTGGSNGTMLILSQGGIYLLSIYIISFSLAIAYSIKRKNFNNIYIYLTIVILLCANAIPYNYIVVYFVGNGIICNFISKGIEKSKINGGFKIK
ncbi:O-antigen ligase like membrane protein [Clostridium pasteurianum DSM 525 = ATCC 6013]|uniref:O-antigen ligase like membrane protein n=1 Tax=Clostridium pasteurianum DSM 525 = ATCC 6013 TaxID=1262449 RepID=A0A0H3J4B9_CLOPA|nr:O-antigen ligase family protein [Clostridium pasteurianum]AJA46758.1 O-antigen ligase like membrane protein [Clostridium pasteurianum DSM 525 = ATCC 6013]AJA50746.1 O-antigen ligase like membrane protein [Clostridium pasteurianum DSM 525 = ATCC 6013]AOZ74152.1 hypothetical protein AQ983_03155 [Clostridium pasteurianum DSM 525 = ATCC 6013]AOZ77949.1 hypothetical protein AQ984_03155 [Clostridium pasteurianum]ELP58632.1 hypothetical protein F502_14170 [Clostridium pasteurianum DSM 525 = ATCC 6